MATTSVGSNKSKAWKLRCALHYGTRCVFCRRDFNLHELTLEHLIPRFRNGSTGDFRNHALACNDCNNEKGGLTPSEYALSLGLPIDHFGVVGYLKAGHLLLPPHEKDLGRINSESKELPLLWK